MEEERGTDLKVRYCKHNQELGEGDEGVGETWGMVASEYRKVKYFAGNG